MLNFLCRRLPVILLAVALSLGGTAHFLAMSQAIQASQASPSQVESHAHHSALEDFASSGAQPSPHTHLADLSAVACCPVSPPGAPGEESLLALPAFSDQVLKYGMAELRLPKGRSLTPDPMPPKPSA